MRKSILILFLFASTVTVQSYACEMDTTAQKTNRDTAIGKRRTPEERAEALINRHKEKLQLKDEQIPKLKEIFMKREKALDNFWEQVRKSEDDMMDDLKKALSAEQF